MKEISFKSNIYFLGKIRPMYEPGYVIHCVSNLTEEKFLVKYV